MPSGSVNALPILRLPGSLPGRFCKGYFSERRGASDSYRAGELSTVAGTKYTRSIAATQSVQNARNKHTIDDGLQPHGGTGPEEEVELWKLNSPVCLW